MPTPTKYTYSIASDFPGAAANTTNLQTEIQASSIVTALDRIDTAGDVIDIWFKDALSTADKTTLDADTTGPAGGTIAAHDNSTTVQPIETISISHKLTGDDRIRVAMEKSDATAFDAYSHNWADPTTWYTSSIRIVDEVATDSGDHITYNLSKTNIIDVYHGKLTGEDDLLDSSSNSYRVTVKIDDVVKTEQDPHTATGGDYTIDYENGDVIMTSALVGTEVVKVTFHYATDSKFKIIPTPGEKVIIEVAEVQFADDVEITDTVFFQTFGYVDVFAPQLLIANGGPYPSLTKIPIRTFKYKTMRDYQNAAFKSYPTCPAMGGVGWRGMPRSVIVFDWDYQRGMTLLSSYGMESHLYLEHDVPFGGSWATATLYCGVDTE
jgi:hypothetical protein